MSIRLKELRNTYSLTQSDIGKLLNKGRNTISRYETGERQLDYESIQILCKYFNVTSDYLLAFSEVVSGQHLQTDEQELLTLYRKCNVETKNTAKNIMVTYINKVCEDNTDIK